MFSLDLPKLNSTQLTAELDRIVGKPVFQEIMEGWRKLAPKVIVVAGEETHNDYIAALLSEVEEDASDGKSIDCEPVYSSRLDFTPF